MNRSHPFWLTRTPPITTLFFMFKSWIKRHRTGIALTVLALLAACARQPELASTGEDPGFFSGLFHGFTLLFALIFGFFDADIAIYALPNSGWPYDVGYLLGVMMFFGGSGASAR